MIPSTNKLAEFLAVNQTTINRSIRDLTDRGILYKKRGIGMFVTNEAKELIKKVHLEEFKQDLLTKFIKEAKDNGYELEEIIQLIKEGYNA